MALDLLSLASFQMCRHACDYSLYNLDTSNTCAFIRYGCLLLISLCIPIGPYTALENSLRVGVTEWENYHLSNFVRKYYLVLLSLLKAPASGLAFYMLCFLRIIWMTLLFIIMILMIIYSF